MSRFLSIEAAALTLMLVGGCGLAAATEGGASVSRPQRGAQTMPELLKLAKTDARARAYLYDYLLRNEIFFATEEFDGIEDVDKVRVRVADDGSALIYTSERALFAAGERAGWKRSESGFSYTTSHGQDAFLVLFSNGFRRAILNRGDAQEFALEAADIEELSDGRIPKITGNNAGSG